MSAFDEALRYAMAGVLVFPCRADKKPLTRHGFKDASTDPEVIEGWLQKWPHCDFGWAVPADVVVVDVDMSAGRSGFEDFGRLAGCDPDAVMTPQASTPSGGRHVVYAASKAYKNAVAIAGTGIDVRSLGGYIVLPMLGNGREWRRPLIGVDGVMVPLAAAPAWLDGAIRQSPVSRAPLVLAPQAALIQPAPVSDSYVRKAAHAQLERACAKIVAAPCGVQDATRHRECYTVGGLVARGDLDYATAYAALLAAADAMPVHRAGEPWRDTDVRVARSLEAGMAAPLPISANESWVRDFRARMQARLTQMKEARNG